MVEFTIAGNPEPLPRPRVTKRGGVYYPARTHVWKQRIQLAARRARVPRLDGELSVSIRFFRRNRVACDVDNLVKAILDALNGIAWNDDHQVSTLTASRSVDVTHPRCEVAIEPLEGQ